MTQDYVYIKDLTKTSVRVIKEVYEIAKTNDENSTYPIFNVLQPIKETWGIGFMNDVYGRSTIREHLSDEYYNQVMEVWGDTPTVEEPQWEEPEPMPITPTETQILGQQITDLEISDIIQGQMITDLELQVLMMEVK